MVQECEVRPTKEAETVQSSENHTSIQQISASISPKQRVGSLFQESLNDTGGHTSLLRDCMTKFGSSLRSQSHLPLIIVVIVAVIFIMQVFTLLTYYVIPVYILELQLHAKMQNYVFWTFCCGP